MKCFLWILHFCHMGKLDYLCDNEIRFNTLNSTVCYDMQIILIIYLCTVYMESIQGSVQNRKPLLNRQHFGVIIQSLVTLMMIKHAHHDTTLHYTANLISPLHYTTAVISSLHYNIGIISPLHHIGIIFEI